MPTQFAAGRQYPASVKYLNHRPSLALDQLQLPLDGIEPLSEEAQVERWLAEQSDETPRVYTAVLHLRDAHTRAARAQRWAEVRVVQSRYEPSWGWLVAGGQEALWLYYDSERAYVDGLFMASLLCAHATCERMIAGCLEPYREQRADLLVRWVWPSLSLIW